MLRGWNLIVSAYNDLGVCRYYSPCKMPIPSLFSNLIFISKLKKTNYDSYSPLLATVTHVLFIFNCQRHFKTKLFVTASACQEYSLLPTVGLTPQSTICPVGLSLDTSQAVNGRLKTLARYKSIILYYSSFVDYRCLTLTHQVFLNRPACPLSTASH